MEFEGRKRAPRAMNLVPLINVVFLLLIFFMLTSTLTTPDTLDVALPESESSEAHESEPIVVILAADGTIAVNNEPVGLGDLVDALKARVAGGRAPSIMVKADAAATTAQVLTVLRRARVAGIERVALAAQGLVAR